MNDAPLPTSSRQTSEAVAEQLVATATQALTAWAIRTREHGLQIPFVGRLIERLTGT